MPKKNEHKEGIKGCQLPSSKMDYTSLGGYGTAFTTLFDNMAEVLRSHEVIDKDIDR